MTSFRLLPLQLRALEAIKRGERFILQGQRSGRRHATEQAIIANASSPEEAQLCLEDLDRHGIALQSRDGRRVDPKPEPRGEDPRFRYLRLNEEKSE